MVQFRDYGVEEQVNDSLAFMRVCDLQLEDDVPDHRIVCRFRKMLNERGSYFRALPSLSNPD